MRSFCAWKPSFTALHLLLELQIRTHPLALNTPLLRSSLRFVPSTSRLFSSPSLQPARLHTRTHSVRAGTLLSRCTQTCISHRTALRLRKHLRTGSRPARSIRVFARLLCVGGSRQRAMQTEQYLQARSAGAAQHLWRMVPYNAPPPPVLSVQPRTSSARVFAPRLSCAAVGTTQRSSVAHPLRELLGFV
ncbi:hypothetical protein C8R43DRAFT_1130250 [Mycena crocata]|nr:hypothetical protein C8R43DRAFT_1130250 [Mycena crocata]